MKHFEFEINHIPKKKSTKVFVTADCTLEEGLRKARVSRHARESAIAFQATGNGNLGITMAQGTARTMWYKRNRSRLFVWLLDSSDKKTMVHEASHAAWYFLSRVNGKIFPGKMDYTKATEEQAQATADMYAQMAANL